jgi:hypothetical protein
MVQEFIYELIDETINEFIYRLLVLPPMNLSNRKERSGLQ